MPCILEWSGRLTKPLDSPNGFSITVAISSPIALEIMVAIVIGRALSAVGLGAVVQTNQLKTTFALRRHWPEPAPARVRHPAFDSDIVEGAARALFEFVFS